MESILSCPFAIYRQTQEQGFQDAEVVEEVEIFLFQEEA